MTAPIIKELTKSANGEPPQHMVDDIAATSGRSKEEVRAMLTDPKYNN